MSVRTTHLVSVIVDDELGRREAMKKKVVVEVSLEVVEDVLPSGEMELARITHVKTHLLDHIGRCQAW
jgi:hypothetical protein